MYSQPKAVFVGEFYSMVITANIHVNERSRGLEEKIGNSTRRTSV